MTTLREMLSISFPKLLHSCGVMTEKLAELFVESATEEHALRPVRRRRLDS